jgi:hypothetical protein
MLSGDLESEMWLLNVANAVLGIAAGAAVLWMLVEVAAGWLKKRRERAALREELERELARESQRARGPRVGTAALWHGSEVHAKRH